MTGPTAIGKTALSLKLAKAVGGEIISADSMQVYRFMDIGTAKIMPEEMEGIPHHLIDVLEPTKDFNVVIFQKMAKKVMEEIYAKGKFLSLLEEQAFIFRRFFMIFLLKKRKFRLTEKN